jgi:glycosyltransferase involved in cell wall biosynthesis
VPVYNAAATLRDCLRSIERQTEQNFECVIVDDGSSDGSLAVARRVAAADDRFLVVAREHEGLVPTLNAGIEHCRAALVARMDADDRMSRRRLELQCHALDDDPQLAAVGCHVRLFPRRDLRAGRLSYERWLNSIDSAGQLERDAFVECPIAHPSLMIRRATLARYRYRNMQWPEDYDLVLRLLAAGERLGVVPRRLLHWRDDATRLSRTHPDYALDRFVACRASFLCETHLRDTRHYVLWGYGGTGKALRRHLDALGKEPLAIVELHPGRLGQRIAGAPVIRPEGLCAYTRAFVVVSVAGPVARQQIRAALDAMGRRELEDYVVCA